MKICFTVAEPEERTEELKKNNKFTPGFDKMTPEALLPWLQINGDKLCAELNAGSYKPMPASGFFVANLDGGYRSLVRLTALDAVIQKVLLDKIGEKCAELFSECSFAYQKGKGAYAALLRYCEGEEKQKAFLKRLCACFDDKCDIYAELTYGTKVTSIGMFASLVYAEKVADCSIKEILYGKYDFSEEKNGVLYNVKSLYDISMLINASVYMPKKNVKLLPDTIID